jgi:LysM repeat protein
MTMANKERVVTSMRTVYLRRRIGAGALLATLTVAIVVAVDPLAGSGGVPASAAGAGPATHAVHVARSGDTLWAIAHEHRGDIAHDRYLDALIGLNGDVGIEIGQAVRLP